MRITPLDIRKQEFHKAMRGLDSEEVYAFLSTVGDEYETLLNDNKALRERVLELDDKVQEYRTMEKTLRDTLLTAERVTVEAKENARREANLIIKEAQIEAEKALRDIKGESMNLHHEVRQLRNQRDGYMARMKVVIESHLQYLQAAESDFDKDDKLLATQIPQKEKAAEPEEKEQEQANASLFAPPEEIKETPVETPPAEPEPAADTVASVEPTLEKTDTETVSSYDAPAPVSTLSAVPDAQDLADPPADAPNGANTLADINDILDKMAEGQKHGSVPPAPVYPDAAPEPLEDHSQSQFEPIPNRPPVDSAERSDTQQPLPGKTQRQPASDSEIREKQAWDYVAANTVGDKPKPVAEEKPARPAAVPEEETQEHGSRLKSDPDRPE